MRFGLRAQAWYGSPEYALALEVREAAPFCGRPTSRAHLNGKRAFRRSAIASAIYSTSQRAQSQFLIEYSSTSAHRTVAVRELPTLRTGAQRLRTFTSRGTPAHPQFICALSWSFLDFGPFYNPSICIHNLFNRLASLRIRVRFPSPAPEIKGPARRCKPCLRNVL